MFILQGDVCGGTVCMPFVFDMTIMSDKLNILKIYNI